MLINCTNHPYEIWNAPQREAAKCFGEVVDLPFPAIDPAAESSDLRKIVLDYAQKIEAMSPAAVLVAGEFTFVFMLVDKLLRDGVKVLSACSKRVTEEVKHPDGTNEKKSVFLFERFREYAYYDVEAQASD
ncbi:MAG: hypothetical protein IJJ13_03160 [Lachnospiraceae bacterium]|nr:hypothetical protein [Lachnospiraceae bacterium]